MSALLSELQFFTEFNHFFSKLVFNPLNFGKLTQIVYSSQAIQLKSIKPSMGINEFVYNIIL